MKILMLLKNTNLMDGVNRHVIAISQALNGKTGVEVAVCIEWPRGKLNEILEAHGVRTYSLNVSNGHSLLALPRFSSVIRDFKPDIVHSHEAGFLVSCALKFIYPRIPRVMTVHAISDPIDAITLRFVIERCFASVARVKYDAYCFISNGVRVHAHANGPNDYVIYNPMDFLDSGDKVKLKTLLGLSVNTLIIGTACRLAEVKQPDAFVRVMCGVLKRNGAVHAVVVGAGDLAMESRLRVIVAKFGVEERFHFMGQRDDARDLIAGMDAFVMTSFREGMPTSLLEAMSGKTLVSFFKGEGGLKDLADLNESQGPFAIVCEQGDEDEMVGRISEILLDDARRVKMVNLASRLGRKHFSIEKIANDLLKVYRGIA